MYNNCGEAQHERMKEREGRKGEGESDRGREGTYRFSPLIKYRKLLPLK